LHLLVAWSGLETFTNFSNFESGLGDAKLSQPRLCVADAGFSSEF
jgi:hypothetical protein